MKIHNTSGDELISVTNDQLPVSVLSTPILDWLTLYCQHTGDDTLTLPYTAISSVLPSVATATTTKYILTRRLVPADLSNVVSIIENTTTTSANDVSIINVRFFLDENLVNDLLLAGAMRAKISADVKSSSTTACYLTSVTLSLKKLTAADTFTTIATKTVTLNASNATAAYVAAKSIIATLPISPEVIVTPSEKLCFEVLTTGKAGSGMTCTHKLIFTAGTSSSYIELGV